MLLNGIVNIVDQLVRALRSKVRRIEDQENRYVFIDVVFDSIKHDRVLSLIQWISCVNLVVEETLTLSVNIDNCGV